MYCLAFTSVASYLAKKLIHSGPFEVMLFAIFMNELDADEVDGYIFFVSIDCYS